MASSDPSKALLDWKDEYLSSCLKNYEDNLHNFIQTVRQMMQNPTASTSAIDFAFNTALGVLSRPFPAIEVAKTFDSVPDVGEEPGHTKQWQGHGATPMLYPSAIPKRLGFGHHFTVADSNDMVDLKQLNDNVIITVDKYSYIVGATDLKGCLIASYKRKKQPMCVTVLDENTVAVAVASRDIEVLEFFNKTFTHKKTIKFGPNVLCTVNMNLLAIGGKDYLDMIDTDGNIIRHLCCGLTPKYMAASSGAIIMSTEEGNLAKVCTETGAFIFHHKVPEIKKPFGVAVLDDQSIMVVDDETKQLCLVTSDGRYVRSLQQFLPEVELRGVSLRREKVICCTVKGVIYVFDLLL